MIPRRVRYAVRFGSDVVLYTLRSGKWWLPAVMIMLFVSVLLVATVKLAVPTAVYTLF